MLSHRIGTALILVLLCGGVLFYANSQVFATAAWLMCLAGVHEACKMYKFSFAQTIVTMMTLTAIAVALPLLKYDVSQIIRIVSVVTWCFVVPLTLIFTPQKFSKLAIAIFCLILFVPAYYAMTVLQALFGPWQLLSIMAIAWVSDTGAYAVGKICGKHKLAKKISPGKSIEGAIGGLVFVIAYLCTLSHFGLAYYVPTYALAVKFAVILTIVGIIGDLLESWFKRVAQVKDSGKILPGHGGVFDRIDSLIAVLAIAFALIRGMI